MRAYVGVTDNNWYRFLADRPGVTEVNFWQPSGAREFRVLAPGEPFFFKTHYPHNKLVGGGFFSDSARLRVSEAWEFFGEANGVAVTVDAALASLDLGQPGLRPADQTGEHGLRQAAPPPGPCDPLPGGLAVGWRHPAPALTGSASMTSRHGGNLRSYGASGSNSTRTPMPRSVSRLAPNAGWLASWGLQCGTTTTGTP